MLCEQVEKLIVAKGLKPFPKHADYQGMVGHIRLDETLFFTMMTQHEEEGCPSFVVISSDPNKARSREENLTVYGCWQFIEHAMEPTHQDDPRFALVETDFSETNDTLIYMSASEDQVAGAVLKMMAYHHSD